MNDVIIGSKNPYKYMHEIDTRFNFMDITDYPNHFLGNKLVKVGNSIHVSSNKYVNGSMRKYQKTQVYIKKEVLPMKFK